MSLIEQVADLKGWQRARIDWVRVSGVGVATLTMMGLDQMVPAVTDVPAGVTLAGWAKPDPITLRVVGNPEAQLVELAGSGLLGDMTVEQITAPDEVRWRAQAWVGHHGRVLCLDSADLLFAMEADADLRLARWRTRAAEVAVQERVREALEAGIAATRVGTALGVTRGRVYQLRDGRR